MQITVILAFHNFFFDSSMKFHFGQIKANDKFHGISSDFVDSRFVKTCDELVYRSCGSSVRSSGSGSNSENARTGMSLKGKDNQTASEDVLKLAPQVLYISSQHIYFYSLRARNRWTRFVH